MALVRLEMEVISYYAIQFSEKFQIEEPMNAEHGSVVAQAEGVRMGSEMGSDIHFIVPKCSTITQ